MKRRILSESRMKGHQRGCDRQLTQGEDTTNSATVGTSWFWKNTKLIHFSTLWLVFTFCWFALIYPIILVSLHVDVEMVSTRKKKQQSKRFFSQLTEKGTDFIHAARSVDGNVLEPDQRDFVGNIEGLQMTSSSRISSHTDLNRIDETRGNTTVEEGDLLVNEKNIDRQTCPHHNSPKLSH